jgi:hypothetical protein
MSKTIDEQLERLASAQERTAEAQERSATALEGILKAIASATVSVRVTETNDDARTDDEPATEETAVEETQVEVAEEAEAEEQQPEPESSAADEPDDAAEAEASDAPGDDDGDPLGDGDAAVDDYPLPAKLTNDTLRGFARDLMEREGKAAVFEVLAEVGKGYKAVGEVSKEDLKEAHLKMAARLKG